MSNKGLVYKGSLSNNGVDDTTSRQVDLQFQTVSPVGANKHAIDTVISGYYEVSNANVVGAGSDSTVVNLVAHGAKKGDLIRFTALAGTITQEFMFIKRVIDANSFELEGILTDSAGVTESLQAGDTFNIGRGVMPRFLDTGELVASIANSPIQINKGPGGVYTAQSVTKDTTVDANTIAMPVEIVGAAGTSINITAGDIGVQLFHNTANPDSVQIGDGTEIMLINASGEAQVRDDDLNTTVTAMSAKLPATLGQKARVASLATTLSTEDMVVIGALATQATLAAVNAKLGNIGQQARAASAAVTLSTEDMVVLGAISTASSATATEVTLAALNAKFGAIGQQARAASAATTLSTEDMTAIGLISRETTLAAMSAKLPATLGQKARAASLAATLSTEDMVVIGALATEITVASISAKLPATLGQKTKVASLAVTLASDSDPLAITAGDIVETQAIFAQALNGSAGAWTEIIAATVANSTNIQIMQKGGEPLHLALGAAAAETVKMIVMPGGSPDTIVPVTIPAGTRVSMRSASTNAVASVDIFFNLIG